MKNALFLIIIFFSTAHSACSSIPEVIKSEYAQEMFDAFITQSYGKSTTAFYQFDIARTKAKEAGENILKIMAIENLFTWYRTYANSLRLYHRIPQGYDRIYGEHKPYEISPASSYQYLSEWGNTPEQAKIIREFMLGVGEIISGVFCVSVGEATFSAAGVTLLFDGGARVFTSLNCLWATHQVELQALKTWEKNSLKPAINN